MTLDDNQVSIGGCEMPLGGVPEPGTATLLGMGLLFGMIACRQQSRKKMP